MAGRPALQLIEVPDRAAWRAWLEANHLTSTGVLLAVGKKRNRVTAVTYEEAVEEALCFGWIDSTVWTLDGDRFQQLFTPRKAGSTWSRSNKGRVERLIATGRMRAPGLAAIEAAKADGSWTLLDEIDALTIPSDLAAALAANPAAARFVEGLADSKKKQLLYWIATAKRAETRARRIADIVGAAAEGRMPL